MRQHGFRLPSAERSVQNSSEKAATVAGRRRRSPFSTLRKFPRQSSTYGSPAARPPLLRRHGYTCPRIHWDVWGTKMLPSSPEGRLNNPPLEASYPLAPRRYDSDACRERDTLLGLRSAAAVWMSSALLTGFAR